MIPYSSKLSVLVKYILAIGMIFSLNSKSFGQNTLQVRPISIGYFGHFGFQPGMKLGTQFNIRNFKEKSEDSFNHRNLYISPQVGFYVYPKVHTGFIFNTDMGYMKSYKSLLNYWAISVGIGYLNQSQITESKINLSNGSKTDTRENWGWLLSTINFEYGSAISSSIGWYGKLSYGYKTSQARETTLALFVELGARYRLHTKH